MQVHCLYMSTHNTATQHLTRFPILRCGQPCCRHNLVYDDPFAIAQLKQPNSWWPVAFIGAFVSIIAHCSGHPPGIHIVFRFSEGEFWSEIPLHESDKKVICIELTMEHYTVTVLDLVENETRHWNGYSTDSPSQELLDDLRQHTLDCLLHLTGLTNPAWAVAMNRPYVRQRDGSSCGPIAILAVYEEIVGVPFTGIEQGSNYNPIWRTKLVDWYIEQFQHLEDDGTLASVS